MTEKFVDINGYEIEVINDIPMDDLQAIVESYRSKRFRDLEFLGDGSYGNVYGYKNYAIKDFKNVDDENKDISILKDISHLDCIPTLYAVLGNRFMIVERIYGLTVDLYTGDNDNEYGLTRDIIDDFEQSLLDIIYEGYSPIDVHGSNVMIDRRTKKPIIVDVGLFHKYSNELDSYDIHNDSGYSTAKVWTGARLDDYFSRLEELEIEKTLMIEGF